jgi:hypothetical protein
MSELGGGGGYSDKKYFNSDQFFPKDSLSEKSARTASVDFKVNFNYYI